MYLRSTTLSLLIVANMGAVNQAGLCVGAAQLAIGAPFLYWLSIKSEQLSRNSSDQAWESRQTLQKMGAKVKNKPMVIKGRVVQIPSHVKYPKNCSQENKKTIDKHLDDLKFAYATQFVCGVGSYVLMMTAFFVGGSGVIDICQAYQTNT